MSRRPKRRRSTRVVAWVVCIVLLTGLYLANLGPLAGMHASGWIPDETYSLIYNTTYFPIIWLGTYTDFFDETVIGRAYIRYVGLFAP